MKSMLKALISTFSVDIDYLDIRIEESETTKIAFKGPSIDTLQWSSEKGGCVRAYYKGGWGFTTFNEITEEKLRYYIRSAIKQAKLVGKEKNYLAPVDIVERVISLNVKRDPREVRLSRKMDVLRHYNDMILQAHESIKTSSVSYHDTYKHTWLATSEGTYVEQEHIDLGGNLIPIAVKGGQTQMAFTSFGSSDDFNVILNLEKELEKSCKIAVDLLDAPSVKGGIYTVVADPKLAGVFVHEAFGHTSEGEKVFENKKLSEIMKFGRKFGSDVLTIYDTGLEKGRRGYLPFDDEGVKTEKTLLIDKGILVGRLHSRETAGRMNERATGNGRALNFTFPPIPRMRTTCIAKGDTPFDDMIKDIDLGIYAVDAMGGQGGEMFSFTAGRGYMIRNGRIEEMVKNVTISGNLFETLKNIDAVGTDFRIQDSGGGCGKGSQFPLPVSSGGPSIRIRNAVIAGS